MGPDAARQALRVDPIALAAFGLMLSTLAGMLSLPFELPFLTGLWGDWRGVTVSTPMVFDIGVYLVVFGVLSAIALGLENGEAE